MNKNLALKILGAILVSSSKKVPKEKLKEFFSEFDLEKLVNYANQRYQRLGFLIYDDGQNLELVNQPELAEYLLDFFNYSENKKILNEFIEILAIIAYGGPISYQEINQIRGKDSLLLIKKLFQQGYIKKEKQNYKISSRFLKILGIAKENELPNYYKLRKELKKII